MRPEFSSRCLVMASVLAASVASAQTNNQENLSPLKLDQDPPSSRNRFGLSYRMGFNISARFKNLGGFAPANRRLTPSGDRWNYDNGYNLSDDPGTPPGMTWYWGYAGEPSKAAQAPGDGFLYLSRSSSLEDGVSSGNSDDPQHGLEFTYSRELGQLGHARWGLEGAFNYMSLSIKDSRTLQETVTTQTDAYSLMGTMIPDAPYYGPKGAPTPGGPNQPVISDTPDPQRSTTTTGTAIISGQRKIDADVYGFRIGPYLEFPLSQKLSLSLNGGLALASVNSTFKFNEVVTGSGAPPNSGGAGSGSHSDLLIGGYAGANFTYSFSQSWSAFAGAQYQNVGRFSQRVGARQADLDFGKSIFVTVGAGFSF